VVDAGGAADGPVGGREERFAPDAGLALARGGREKAAGTGEELLAVFGANIVGVRAGENERVGADRPMPAKGSAQFVGGIEDKARQLLGGAVGGDAGEGLAVVLVVAVEAQGEVAPVSSRRSAPQAGGVPLRRRAVMADFVQDVAADKNAPVAGSMRSTSASPFCAWTLEG